MLLNQQQDNLYWFTSFVIGSIIAYGLILAIPHIQTRQVQPVPVIELDFIPWQKPAEQQPEKKPIPKPKPKPKPKPPEPVIAEKELPPQTEPQPIEEKIEPEPEVVEEQIEEQPEEEALPTPVAFSQLTALPRFIHREIPIYPATLKVAGKEGTVKLAVLIDSEGRVRNVEVITSAGALFDQAAIKAMYGSSFQPGMMEGKKVTVLLKVPIKFRLR